MEKLALGIDIGNGTIKCVLINKKKEVVDFIYTRNLGIIETLKKALKELFDRNKNVTIISCGIIGAGRKLGSILLSSNITTTEITATAIGVMNYFPENATCFEMGFEDSKILIIKNGVLVDFAMNTICSANCGAYIENVSARLGIKVEEFSDYALKSKSPANISGKCAVFGTSCCVSKINLGFKKEDILMGVAYALVRNYFSMLAKGKSIFPPYVFCGGVSKNKAIVKAIEDYLGEKVYVPEYSFLIGAIGVAILSLEKENSNFKFKGYEFLEKDYSTETTICDKCTNNCELVNIYENGKLLGRIGSNCGKYNL
ncbi:MAG: acyl-CoA dehydratase activase [Candidatus Omnitrophica bacterium]|nr:acyl-CoA dehydratase activase [Candidatus Omnitrophota bacterium]MCM8806999.1 acyl-CoA dehydratase activase [Candidatus Omnitrophota bacterium]